MSFSFPIPVSDNQQALFKPADEAASLVGDLFRASEVIYAEPPRVSHDNKADTVGVEYLVGRQEELTWSNTQERKFARLAAKIAANKADGRERKEFSELQVVRRRTRNPLSSEDIVFDYKRRQLEARLLASLHNYVEFIETPRSQEA